MAFDVVFDRRRAGRPLVVASALAMALGSPEQTALALSYPCSSPNAQQSFTNDAAAGTTSGSIQSLVVPGSLVTIDAAGAQGGAGENGGGLGAEVVATMPATPGQTLCVVVGVQGGSAGNGAAGGGGASYVYVISSGTCASNLALVTTGASPNVLVAAAGGGGSGEGNGGGNGSAPGGAGTAGASPGAGGNLSGAAGGTGGAGGGTQGNSGGGGGLSTDGGSANGVAGGQALVDGADGGLDSEFANGGFGGGGAAATPGGGGGGYNGGGAGGGDADGGGGGGGSFSATAPQSPYTQSGVQSGNGAVNVCYTTTPAPPAPTLSWPAELLLLSGLLSAGLALLRRRA